MLQSEISSTSSRADFLREAAVIIIDEAPSGNKAIFACIDDILRTVTRLDSPFGNKVLILVGDFRQCGPVIPNGTRADVVEASLISSHLWPLFTVRRLSAPIRNAQDPDFATFVDSIGDGLGPEVRLPMVRIVHTEKDLIDFVWSSESISNPARGLTRCILAVTNRQVNKFNHIILNKVPGEERRYFASDSIQETSDNPNSEFLDDAESGLLDYYTANNIPGLPLFSLSLKVGSLCRIMRNLSIKHSLVKNTRVVITALQNHVISVRKVTLLNDTGVLDNEDILLPRIKFIHHLRSGHTLARRQFPIALAYASTFNSCQGLTLDAVGCDLTLPAFAHGQLYVALSRIRRRDDACVLLRDSNGITTNVTYEELLLPE
jgi:ATP-dependent DNA helicase PIF1